MNKFKANCILNRLLHYDLCKFAQNIGLLNEPIKELTIKEAAQLLNLAESYSRSDKKSEHEKCLLICGLIWEHRNSEWIAIAPFIALLLTRLGLCPSTKMLTEFYDEYNDSYGRLGSFIQELNIVAEFEKYEVNMFPKPLLLSAFQRRVWDAIDQYKYIGISAPTSAGKSYVLANKIAEFLCRGAKEIVYIVPTLSLVNQVTSDIRKVIKGLKLSYVEVTQTYSEYRIHSKKQMVFVLTQERASSAILQSEEAFKNLDLFIVDEVQNIERVAEMEDERAHIMFNVIQDFINNIDPPKVVICGPRLKNIDDLVKNILGRVGNTHVTDEIPPVVNMTYTFSRADKKIEIKQYCTVKKMPIKIQVDNSHIITSKMFGGRRYTQDIYSLMSIIISGLNEKKSGTVVFSPTSTEAAKTALGIAKEIKEDSTNLKDVIGETLLIDYIKDSVHPHYSLVDTIPKRIAYHHGKMPLHARMAVEAAFRKLVVDTVVCTTTLLQGVNFPAKNLIARNPNLFIQQKKDRENPQLTAYEFANLRGRAGRLMKDFVGRAIILDEETFKNAEIDMADYPDKHLNSGYGERFEHYEDEIINYLTNNEPVNIEILNNDLIVYIRQAMLKYENSAVDRLNKVGIIIDGTDYQKIKKQLRNLSVSKEICIANPYWDPLVLDDLYKAANINAFAKIPSSPTDTNYIKNLTQIITTISRITPYYYHKYFGISSEIKRSSILRYAKAWSNEVPLRKIISWGDNLTTEDIDNRIDDINKYVVYSLPKILRPVVNILEQDSPILSYMEMGAFLPISRRLIELGIPRETAIKIVRMTPKSKVSILNESSEDNILLNHLKNVYDELNYWEQLQVQDLIR